MHCARFRIVRTVYQALNARMYQRSGAHGTRFNCSKQLAFRQTMVAERRSGLAQRHDLSVRRWIGIGDVEIPSPANDAAFADDYCADGDFSGFERALGGAEGFLHPEFVGFGRLSLIVGRWHGGIHAAG
jgi:hypothetical protein